MEACSFPGKLSIHNLFPLRNRSFHCVSNAVPDAPFSQIFFASVPIIVVGNYLPSARGSYTITGFCKDMVMHLLEYEQIYQIKILAILNVC